MNQINTRCVDTKNPSKFSHGEKILCANLDPNLDPMALEIGTRVLLLDSNSSVLTLRVNGRQFVSYR